MALRACEGGEAGEPEGGVGAAGQGALDAADDQGREGDGLEAAHGEDGGRRVGGGEQARGEGGGFGGARPRGAEAAGEAPGGQAEQRSREQRHDPGGPQDLLTGQADEVGQGGAEHPREVGVALDGFAGVEHDAQPFGQVAPVAEGDPGVVLHIAHEGQGERHGGGRNTPREPRTNDVGWRRSVRHAEPLIRQDRPEGNPPHRGGAAVRRCLDASEGATVSCRTGRGSRTPRGRAGEGP